MGWLWASSSSSKSPASAPTQESPASPPSLVPPSTTTAPNEPVDPEIQKFLSLLKPETDTANKQQSTPLAASSTNTPASSSPSSSSSWFSLRTSEASSANKDQNQQAPIGSAVSESLLPTEMSCSQAFDLAWACNSLGGQWNAVYRYGEMRSCSELWNDFWFCMRTKSYTGELKEAMIKAHYRQKEHAKYGPGRPSSEDVWEARAEKVAPGSYFQESFEPPAVKNDDEWRNNEQERRKLIREGLGLDKP